jgi:hypothetical protein
VGQLGSNSNSYPYVWETVGSNLGRVLTVLTATCWFYQPVFKFGGIIPLIVPVNAGKIQQFVHAMLIIPPAVPGKSGRMYDTLH